MSVGPTAASGDWVSAGEITPLLRRGADVRPSSERARMGGTTPYAQQAADVLLRQPGSTCRQNPGERGLQHIQRRAVRVDGARRAIFSPVKARVPLPLPGSGRK